MTIWYVDVPWKRSTLEWKMAVVTRCLVAAFGGVVSFAPELWARHHYAGQGRAPRPLVLLHGFIRWPTMVPDAVEGVLVDAGVLEQSGRRA